MPYEEEPRPAKTVLVKTLSQTNPDFDLEYIENYRTVYEGGKSFQQNIIKFLPKNPLEPDQNYAARVRNATYLNYAGPVVDFLDAWLFSEALQIDGFSQDLEWADAFFKNVDRNESDKETFFSRTFANALVGKRGAVWVTRPSDGGLPPETLLEEEARGLNSPYFVQIAPENLTDWHYGDDGKLAWVLLAYKKSVRESALGPRKTVYIWQIIDRERVLTYEWVPEEGRLEPTPTSEARQIGDDPHNLGFVPVTIMEFEPGLWAMSKLYQPALGHFRRHCAKEWALDRSAHALAVVKTGSGDFKPQVATGTYLSLTVTDGYEESFEFVSPSSDSFQMQKDSADSLREEIHRVVHQMALATSSDSSKSRMSGDSKEKDFQAILVILAAYGRKVRSLVASCMTMAQTIRGVTKEAINVVGLDGYDKANIAQAMETMALGMPLIRSETWRREMAKGIAARTAGNMLDEGTRDQIEAELDAAPYNDEALMFEGIDSSTMPGSRTVDSTLAGGGTEANALESIRKSQSKKRTAALDRSSTYDAIGANVDSASPDLTKTSS